MKNQIAISKKDLFRKRKAKHSADMRIALQLYAFHKAETVIKKEPRIPRNDPRRPVSPPKHSLSFSQYLKLLVTSNNSSIRASKSSVHHTAASLSPS
jgi:hypothetical protein